MKTLLKQQLGSGLLLLCPHRSHSLEEWVSDFPGQYLFRWDLGSSRAPQVCTRTRGLSDLPPAPKQSRGPTSPKRPGERTAEQGELRKSQPMPASSILHSLSRSRDLFDPVNKRLCITFSFCTPFPHPPLWCLQPSDPSVGTHQSSTPGIPHTDATECPDRITNEETGNICPLTSCSTAAI